MPRNGLGEREINDEYKPKVLLRLSVGVALVTNRNPRKERGRRAERPPLPLTRSLDPEPLSFQASRTSVSSVRPPLGSPRRPSRLLEAGLARMSSSAALRNTYRCSLGKSPDLPHVSEHYLLTLSVQQ